MDFNNNNNNTHTHIFSFPRPYCWRAQRGGGARPPHQTGGVRGGKAPLVPVYASPSDCIMLRRAAPSPASYNVVLRAPFPGVVRRCGVASPWQAVRRFCLPLGARHTPFEGPFPRIASAAVAGGWGVERRAIRTWDAGQTRVRDVGHPERPSPDVAIPRASR